MDEGAKPRADHTLRGLWWPRGWHPQAVLVGPDVRGTAACGGPAPEGQPLRLLLGVDRAPGRRCRGGRRRAAGSGSRRPRVGHRPAGGRPGWARSRPASSRASITASRSLTRRRGRRNIRYSPRGGNRAPLGRAARRSPGRRALDPPRRRPRRAVAESCPTAFLVANVQTGRFWGSRPDPAALLDYLAGEDPAARSRVGRGPLREPRGDRHCRRAGARGRPGQLPEPRLEGHHLQPADALAAALERGDEREGGVLCIAPAADAGALRYRLASDGFELRHWDNGTPAPVTASPKES